MVNPIPPGDAGPTRLWLYLILDFEFLDQRGRDAARTLAQAVDGGVTLIQLRTKRMSDPELVWRSRPLVQIAHERGANVVVNDRPYVARQLGLRRVHLGQLDMKAADAKAILGPHAILGRSVNTPLQARRAFDEGANYLGAGPVFGTVNKANPSPVLGLPGLGNIVAATPLPVVAIGGIMPEHVAPIFEAGAYGVAILGGILGAPDVTRAARQYRAEIEAFGVGVDESPAPTPQAPSGMYRQSDMY